MLNIEKYEDEIKAKVKNGTSLECVIHDIRGACSCGEPFRCTDCQLKSLDWILQEYKEPVLTEEGIEFLKGKIKRSSKKALYIKIRKKVANYCEYRLEIHLDTGLISMPFAEKSKQYEMFKNMEIGVSYTPKELGL